MPEGVDHQRQPNAFRAEVPAYTNLLQQFAALALRQHCGGKLGRAEAHIALGSAAGLKRALHARACSVSATRFMGRCDGLPWQQQCLCSAVHAGKS